MVFFKNSATTSVSSDRLEEKELPDIAQEQYKAIHYLIHRNPEGFENIPGQRIASPFYMKQVLGIKGAKETFDRLEIKFPGMVDSDGKSSIPKLATGLYIESDDPNLLTLLALVIKRCKYSKSDIEFMTKYDPPKSDEA